MSTAAAPSKRGRRVPARCDAPAGVGLAMPRPELAASPPPPPPVSMSARAPRISRTGIVERSVAAAVISAARQRGLARKPRPLIPPSKPELPAHHRRHGGFCNPWDSALRDSSLRSRAGSGSRTFFKVAKDRRPPDEQLATMLLLADRPKFESAPDVLRRDKHALASFWIGHSTFLLQARGLTVLTDPVWSLRLGPLGPRRLVPPPCETHDLPARIDAAVLSSACYDHYDKNAVSALADRVGIWLVPLGLKPLLVAAGVPDHKVVQLDWWQEYTVNGALFACTPAQHYSVRDDTLWCSWVIRASNHQIFFCGATGYRSVGRDLEDSDVYEHREKFGGPSCPVFKEIHGKYGAFDTAFLPIGGFKPRVLMSGVQGDAVDMLFVHRDLKARRSVVHRWGTFASSDEGMLDAIRVLENGVLNSPVAEHEISYVRHGRLHVT